MSKPTLDAAVASMQQILDRDYPHLEWRVLLAPPVSPALEQEPVVHVHARTRDFRFRCRISRPWSRIQAAPRLQLLVADLAAEAEHTLADLAAASYRPSEKDLDVPTSRDTGCVILSDEACNFHR